MSSHRILYHHRIRADDGQAVHVRELISALRSEGHEVLECALVPKADPPSTRSGGGGSAWRRLRLPRWATEMMEIGYDRQGVSMLMGAAREFRPDMLYERHALHCASGLKASRELAIPLLLEVNSPMCDEMTELGALRFPGRAARTERDVLGGAQRVLAVTDVLRQRLIERGADPARTRVIGNGGEPERYGEKEREAGREWRARMAPDAFVVGFVGYMRPWHRLDLALEAMTRPGLGAVHLALVGDGPALRDVLDMATDLRLGDRVHTMGDVSADQMRAHVSAFDAALIPAINAYASPLKLFDAFAAGVPVVAPDQPNIAERIEDGRNGLLFAPNSAGSLGSKLEELARERQRARDIGAAGRRSLVDNEWTWRGNARRVVACFEELVG